MPAFTGVVALLLVTGLPGCQHPGYLSADEPCKGPNLSMVQQPAGDSRDQQFVIKGVGAEAPGGGPQKCRLRGTIALGLTAAPGGKRLAHLEVPFDATVGGGLGPVIVSVTWSNWCMPDRRADLTFQFNTEDSGSGGSRTPTDFPECRDPKSVTTLRRT